MSDAVPPTPTAASGARARPWTLPRITELPKLTALTLASAIGGGGGTGGSGSTVFGLLFALLSLGACSADRMMSPADHVMPAAVTAVTCTANVAAKLVYCGGPLNVPPSDEILGGQGVRVMLRSRNVNYIGTDFTFEVQVQNVSAQSIGTDGVDPTGVRVFFEAAPVVTSGPGDVTNVADSSGTFTAASQPYYVYHDSIPARDTSAWEPWHFTVDAANTTFTFEVLVSAQVPDHGGILRWEPISALSSYGYADVAWSGGNDALAVGYNGHAKKWNGTTWTTVNTGTTTDLWGVAAISQGVYLVVGGSGRIFKVSGKVWTLVYESPTLWTLNEIWARDADHWIAIGEEGTIIRYDAGLWTEENMGAGVYLDLVTGSADGDFVAVASTGGSGEYYTSTSGGSFTLSFFPNGPGPYIAAMATDADGGFYWSEFDGAAGYIIRSDLIVDTVAIEAGRLAFDIFPFDHDSLIASMLDVVTFGLVPTKYRYVGAARSLEYTTDPLFDFGGFSTPLNAAGTDYAAICGCQSIVTTISAGPWTAVEDLEAGSFTGSWGRGDSVWVVEESGELWKIVNGAATLLNGVEGATGIAGFSGDSLFITADSMLYVGNGTAPWVEATRLVDVGPDAFFHSIWADTLSHTLIVTGENGRVMQRVAGAWSELPAAGMNVSGVWGCSATEAWVVSVNSAILKWTPGALTPDALYLGGTPLEAITGMGCNDVWAGGANSALFHWNGSGWAYTPPSGDQIFIGALTPRGVGAVYAGGEDGKVASVTSAGVTSRMVVNSQADDINTLWRFNNGDLLAAGSYTVTVGRR